MRTVLALLFLAGCAESPALGIGQHVDGALAEGDESIHPGAVADVVRVRLEAGEAAVLLVSSEVLAPFVIVTDRDRPWGADAGVANGEPACIALDAPDGLDLQVYVSSAGGAGYGAYRVSVVPFSHEVADRHGCQVGGPEGHPSPREPTFTAGSRPRGDHHRGSAV